MTITSKWSQLVSGRSILGKTVIFSTFSTIPHFRGSPKNVIQKYYQWTPNGLKHAHNWFLGSRFWAKHLTYKCDFLRKRGKSRKKLIKSVLPKIDCPETNYEQVSDHLESIGSISGCHFLGSP